MTIMPILPFFVKTSIENINFQEMRDSSTRSNEVA